MKHGFKLTKWFAFVVIVSAFSVGILGCSGQKRDREILLDRSRTLLDHRQYDRAIQEISDALEQYPGDQDIALLLAHAHLGAIGMETIPFFDALMDHQDFTTLDLSVRPNCDNEKIRQIKGTDLRCILLRAMRRLPDADNSHLLEAQRILRVYFPIPSRAPMDVNFLAAFIELSSAASRVESLLDRDLIRTADTALHENLSAFPFEVFIHHSKRILTEADWAILRLRSSYGKLMGLIRRMEGKPLLKIGERTLFFSENLSGPEILHFLGQALEDTEPLFSRAINTIAESAEKRTGVDIPEVAVDWKHPPPLIQGLVDAARQSWDLESREPLVTYFATHQEGWFELKNLIRTISAVEELVPSRSGKDPRTPNPIHLPESSG